MNPLKVNIGKALKLLIDGYTFRELALKFIRLFIFSKLKSIILYFPSKISLFAIVDYKAVIDGVKKVEIGRYSYIQEDVWLTVPIFEIGRSDRESIIKIGKRVRIGRRSIIAAIKGVRFQDDVLLGPNVTILDHVHCYDRTDLPISNQGIKSNGEIVIESGCWIGANSVICSRDGDLVIGRNSIISANSVVRDSVPPYTIVAGNPARVVANIL